ncbi:dihydroorotate oxidase B, electron transfer subunit [Archaeoglobus sulfaticallidus PM70-1]|uniref:Dihydroorotate oxidase B, electron transfer subunit n=1 Tax=Archaeoglobus sulfaticallidus PM70-1 TaxID=387631 RepID=N0BIV6_9EURY|nr:dihydroorotate dehydrogenase electron transfer subunit [Archaeoglobus sulfaticallidus]AGK60406.1 dihydroorotate oxidase B, electron transfer subunit [Archaeoglobus sulfaticallidus PM70-1]
MFSLKVDKIIKHSETVSTIFFNSKLRSYPGQFVMLNLFDYEEIPLSLSSPYSVTVKAVGTTTEALVRIRTGELVGIRGPFGKPFTPTNGKALLVAGGIGSAPLYYLHDYLKNLGAEVHVIFGGKTSADLIWKDRFESVELSTEDGSEGYEGTVIDLMRGKDLEGFDKIYICGPEGMLIAAYRILKERNLLSKAEFSLESYMKCGIGVCGTCVLKDGSRVCVEGPVFSGEELEDAFD